MSYIPSDKCVENISAEFTLSSNLIEKLIYFQYLQVTRSTLTILINTINILDLVLIVSTYN